MKYFIVILFLFFSMAVKAETFDVDYNFIDTAFDGLKPVSDKEFNDTINKLTPQPVENTFGAKLRTFLFGRKYGIEPDNNKQIQEKDIDLGGETKAIQDIKNGIYYITLTVSVVGADGNIIPLGNYKVQEKIIDNEPMLVFYQGYQEYGKLKLKNYEDTQKKENDFAYSRVDIVNDYIVRIVYSTIQDTKCAYAKVYLQN